MNFTSNFHRVDAFSPPLIVEARYIVELTRAEVKSMTLSQLSGALWGRGTISPPEETVTGNLRCETHLRPSNIARIIERCERIRRNQLRRTQ